jgi:hypothetical protein
MPVNLFLPQVTRIPITGPEPYNTLVCVQTETVGGFQQVTPGKMSRWATTVGSGFRLAGFDQRVPPVFDHSTTAYLSSIGPAKDDNWVYAVDEVTGAGFSSYDGSYYVNLNVAMMPGDPVPDECFSFGGPYGICLYWTMVQVTSFVLCYEPPPPEPPGGHRRFVPRSAMEAAFSNRLPPGAGLAERIARQMGVAFAPPSPDAGGQSGAKATGSGKDKCPCGGAVQ